MHVSGSFKRDSRVAAQQCSCGTVVPVSSVQHGGAAQEELTKTAHHDDTAARHTAASSCCSHPKPFNLQPCTLTCAGRARLGGMPVGVIAVESATVMLQVPADPGMPDSSERTIPQVRLLLLGPPAPATRLLCGIDAGRLGWNRPVVTCAAVLGVPARIQPPDARDFPGSCPIALGM